MGQSNTKNPPPDQSYNANNNTQHQPLPKLISEVPSQFLNDEETLAFLSKALPGNEYRQSWTLLYSSAKHGKSFNRFCYHVCGYGSNLVLIRDTGQAKFGGFVDYMWREKFAKYYGEANSFVFQLSPKKIVYHPTGYNDHYQYINQGTQTMFNGIGMGGQEGFFAWGIGSDFEKGMCRGDPSTTFGNPILASSADWLLDYMEVWEVKPPSQMTYEQEKLLENKRKTKSVLADDNNAEKVFTGMMGHEFSHEEKIKKDDDEEEEEEEK